MKGTSIFACTDPRRAEWQLGRLPPATGRMTLIGWAQEPERVDAGVPREVSAVLARALVSVSRVTFLSSVPHPAVTAKGTPAHDLVVSTRNPDSVMRAFDDPGYPWWMQGQLLLLSATNAPPPGIERNQLLELFEDDWTRDAQALARLGIVGAVRPGVDGDVAGLLSLTAGFDDVVLRALENEAKLASCRWSVLTEEELAFR